MAVQLRLFLMVLSKAFDCLLHGVINTKMAANCLNFIDLKSELFYLKSWQQ